jgi:hypothetical protein
MRDLLEVTSGAISVLITGEKAEGTDAVTTKLLDAAIARVELGALIVPV